MGKIGAYEYPDISFSETLKLAGIIEDKFSGSIQDKNSLSSFASLLGHKNTRSGGFVIKTLALKRYNLLKDNRLTQIAEVLLHPKNEDEKQNSIKEVISAIELFRKIFEKVGTRVQDDNFWEYLVAVTSVGRQEAIASSEKIRKLYLDMLKYVNKDNMGEGRMLEQPIAGNSIELKSGDVYFKVPKTADSIDLIINLLNKWKSEQKEKK